jgi:hypothetical protein
VHLLAALSAHTVREVFFSQKDVQASDNSYFDAAGAARVAFDLHRLDQLSQRGRAIFVFGLQTGRKRDLQLFDLLLVSRKQAGMQGNYFIRIRHGRDLICQLNSFGLQFVDPSP